MKFTYLWVWAETLEISSLALTKQSIMKNLYLLILLLGASQIVAQTTPQEKYIKAVDHYLEDYKYVEDSTDNMVIQPSLLDDKLEEYFNAIVFSGSNTVSDATALGVSINDDNTTISAKANFNLGDDKSFFMVGVNASGKGGIFNLYNDDSWGANVGGNLGVIIKLFGSSYIDEKGSKQIQEKFNDSSEIGSKFKELLVLRKLALNEPLARPEIYSRSGLMQINDLQDKLLTSSNERDYSNYSTLINAYEELKKMINTKDYVGAYRFLEDKQKEVRTFVESTEANDPTKAFEQYIKDKFKAFDKENDMTYGYTLGWADVNMNLSNGSYNFEGDNVEESIQESFNDLYGNNNPLNVLNTRFTMAFNMANNRKKSIRFLKVGIGYNRTSYLESNLAQGTPRVVNIDDEYVLQDENDLVLGRYDDISKTLVVGDFNAYGAIFFTKKKNFGVNASIIHRLLMNKPASATYYKNNFTLLAGPVFRTFKDDGEPSLIFGLDMGWDNAIYRTKIDDDFTARLRVGIPFKIAKEK